MQLQGTIKHIGDLQQGEGKNKPWKKRELVIEYKDGNYEKLAPFQMMGDKTSVLDNFQVGQSVTVWFNIEGRLVGDRWYTNLIAWKIE